MEKVSLIRFSLVPLKNNSRDSVVLGKAFMMPKDIMTL